MNLTSFCHLRGCSLNFFNLGGRNRQGNVIACDRKCTGTMHDVQTGAFSTGLTQQTQRFSDVKVKFKY